VAGFPAELEGCGAGGLGVAGESKVVVQAADEQRQPSGDDQEFSVLTQSRGSFEQLLDVFELVACVRPEFVSGSGRVFAA
jgi:hypothetical protein